MYPPLHAVGAYEHEGPFLRFLVGPSKTSASTAAHSLSGSGAELGFAVGYALRPSLILHLDLVVSNVDQPDEELDGAQVDRDLSIFSYGVGPGAPHYFAHDVYATAAVHATWFKRVERREVPPDDLFDMPEEMRISEGRRAGIGASAAIGKEWWPQRSATPDRAATSRALS